MTRTQTAFGSLLIFFVVPGVISGLIPTFLITGGWVTPPILGLTALPWLGWALIGLGTLLLVDTFIRFVRHNGTPAPLAQTARLVAEGPYRYVRNPMYIAVLMTIAGQSFVYGCHLVLLYGVGIWLATHLFLLFYEEPNLKARFPADYDAYIANVPRWIPRLTPWQGAATAA